MEPDLDPINEYLEENGIDGYLIHATGLDANQRYVSGFGAVDPFESLFTNGNVYLMVRSLERGLAESESRAETVWSAEDFDRRAIREEHGSEEVPYRVLSRFLTEHDVTTVAVPDDYPLGLADGLREMGHSVEPDRTGVIDDIREVKMPEEIDYIRAAQRATERSMHRAESLLAEATIREGVLYHDGEPLTSERIKNAIELSLVKDGYALEETIVSCGEDAAEPHHRGRGPLSANESIVIDIFPRDKQSKYHADMTRTFCVGTPSEALEEWYDLTCRAQDAAFDVIGPGVDGEAVHDAVCDVYEDAGLPTKRADEQTATGFIHSTGHGLGLELHEGPGLSSSTDELEPGHVVTVEPGLYDPAVGGVRIEDVVAITEDGFENLTEYDRNLIV